MRKPVEFEDVEFPGASGSHLWTYRGILKHVVDGDTFDVLVDQGFNDYAYITVRLRGVDTPEIFRPESEEEREAGYAAKRRVEELVLGRPVILRTYKDRTSFGRYVAHVWYKGDDGMTHLGETLLNEGLAVRSRG